MKIKEKRIVIIIFIVSLLSGVFIGKLCFSGVTEENINTITDVSALNNSNEDETEKNTIFVDIKGAVKKPGVYEMEVNQLVNDAIKKAGGLTKSAYTKNINLSQKLKDEMVIYIFSSSEIKKMNEKIITDTTCQCETIEVNNCITNPTKTNSSNQEEQTTKIININTASKEELMSISGLGDSKADAIITYRKEHPFTNVEEIKNVSGIGDSVFAKIKDYITV